MDIEIHGKCFSQQKKKFTGATERDQQQQQQKNSVGNRRVGTK